MTFGAICQITDPKEIRMGDIEKHSQTLSDVRLQAQWKTLAHMNVFTGELPRRQTLQLEWLGLCRPRCHAGIPSNSLKAVCAEGKNATTMAMN